jgi:hypothetical protein
MSRLTYKDTKVSGGYNAVDTDEYACVVKLGKLEDLEEQLGCPLEVVIKALKIGIFAKDLPSEKIVKWYVRLSNVETEWYLSDDNKMCINLKGYKNIWWLKKDKSE